MPYNNIIMLCYLIGNLLVLSNIYLVPFFSINKYYNNFGNIFYISYRNNGIGYP